MAEAQDWFTANAPKVVPPPVAPPPVSTTRPSASARAGVPAAGRGSQIDPDQSMRGVELATTPLAHPTGVDAIDSFTSPVGLASLAAGGAGIVRAGASGGVSAGIKAAAEQVSPQIKYELTKKALQALHVPEPMAMAAAFAISGLKRGAKAEPSVSNAAPAGVETAQEALARKGATVAAPASPVSSAPVVPAPPAAAPPPPAGPSAQAVARPSPLESTGPSGGALPDQKALNEAALQARRAAYQAKVSPPAPPAKLKLSATESREYMTLRKAGQTHAAAVDAIEAARAFQEKFGLTTPTAADTKFPKGMRGGQPK